MSKCEENGNANECNKKSMEQFMKTVKTTICEVGNFNANFTDFLSQQKKQSKELWNWVTRYNILNAGPPCVYPIVEKEELLQDLLVKIQDKSSKIFSSLKTMKESFDNLSKSLKALERQSLTLEWNVTVNPAARGSVKHRPPSEYLEDIANIVFQFDIAITCIFQYYEALDLKETKSYEHLINSFSISQEVVDFVREFLIKNVTLFT